MPKLELTAKTIQPYLDRIKRLKMIVPVWFWLLTAGQIAECYNGVGSDLTAKPLRKALSWIFRWALCAVIIHDVIWSKKEIYGLTIEDFYDSNESLKTNARTELKDNTARWRPLYTIRRGFAWVAQKACDGLGKTAWNIKNKERKKK